MKRNGGGADGSFGPLLGERAVWDDDSPDHECDCPGPPPEFYLPPPPRPSSLEDSDCSDNFTSQLETCEAVPVIDAEYHYSPAIPSLAIILAVAVAVVVFLFIGTFLVVLKKRKMQNLFPRKSSPQSRCDSASANGVIYEDLANVRPRMLSSPHCPPGQTTLPSIEMIDVSSYPVFICQDAYDSRELFNPVYEELSNGSGDGAETDSEGLPRGGASEDEFAEDELSLGGDGKPGETPPGPRGGDVDSSDVDDKCKFLENFEGHAGTQGRRTVRGPIFRGSAKRPKSLDRRKPWRKAPPPLPPPPADCEFHEGFLLKRILQIYPDVTGVGLQYSRGGAAPNLERPEDRSVGGGGRYETLDAFSRGHPRRPKPEIFSTFGPGKNQSQDSSLGSDSGYSNNTSGGGKSSSRPPRKEFGMANHSDSVVLS